MKKNDLVRLLRALDHDKLKLQQNHQAVVVDTHRLTGKVTVIFAGYPGIRVTLASSLFQRMG